MATEEDDDGEHKRAHVATRVLDALMKVPKRTFEHATESQESRKQLIKAIGRTAFADETGWFRKAVGDTGGQAVGSIVAGLILTGALAPMGIFAQVTGALIGVAAPRGIRRMRSWWQRESAAQVRYGCYSADFYSRAFDLNNAWFPAEDDADRMLGILLGGSPIASE